jgi:hypothetical protein
VSARSGLTSAPRPAASLLGRFRAATLRRAALAGTYAGATAGGTVGAGAGVNLLVGGSNRTVALQPISVQAQTGMNIAAGVSTMELRPATAPTRRRQ